MEEKQKENDNVVSLREITIEVNHVSGCVVSLSLHK